MKKVGMTTNWPFHPGTQLPSLLTVRWLGQIGDGIFQSALASFVLFSPERQTNAFSAASAFAVVLLPYSLVGPYAGVFLDRFSRQRIVQLSNLLRAVDLLLIAILIKSGATGIYLTLLVLVAFGINRLILAGLSAGLPLIVTKDELISANALAVTGGSIGVVIGGGIGIGVKKLFDAHGKSDLSDAKVVLIAALLYVASAIVMKRLSRTGIGPTEHETPIQIRGIRELQEGLRILNMHPDALRGIFAMAISRGGLTALTLMGLLLERNTFNLPSNPDAGLAAFAYALGVAGVGFGVGSFITPFFVSYFGRHRWIRLMVVAPGIFLIFFAFIPQEWLLITTAFFVAACGQAVKVTNDALVQSQIHDEYRGRVFAFYDIAVNSLIVLGAIIAALILPTSGKSVALPLLTTGVFAATSLILLRTSKFFSLRPR
ncbi:MAG: MFS transporter [Actinomycetota bacterium]